MRIYVRPECLWPFSATRQSTNPTGREKRSPWIPLVSVGSLPPELRRRFESAPPGPGELPRIPARPAAKRRRCRRLLSGGDHVDETFVGVGNKPERTGNFAGQHRQNEETTLQNILLAAAPASCHVLIFRFAESAEMMLAFTLVACSMSPNYPPTSPHGGCLPKAPDGGPPNAPGCRPPNAPDG